MDPREGHLQPVPSRRDTILKSGINARRVHQHASTRTPTRKWRWLQQAVRGARRALRGCPIMPGVTAAKGAVELAEAVAEARARIRNERQVPVRAWRCRCVKRVELIAKEVYGADGVDWARPGGGELGGALRERSEVRRLLHHDGQDPSVPVRRPDAEGRADGLASAPSATSWSTAERSSLCPMAGTISMMPGTAADPAYRRVDVDTETGKVSGLF